MKSHLASNITAIIPCYNDGAFIMEAVNSLLNQTLSPEKILIVDDGSGVTTKKVLAAIDHPAIEIIHQANKGVSSARNRGVEQATTEWILTLDADDYYEVDFVEKALDLINKNSNISIITSYYRKFDKSNNVNDIIEPAGGSVRNFLVRNNGVASTLFKKECWKVVNGYDVEFDRGYEDWDFWISVLSKGYKMHVIPQVLFNYRVKAFSRDQDALRHYDEFLRRKLYHKHRDVYLEHIDDVILQLIKTNASFKKTIVKRENSLDYRWGKSMLAPLRWINQSFFRKEC
ncbi:glycosyltransferase family 2 protein [Nonlabens agnitus]|uniref:Glycosyltransferase 2-like domain-containing protein n=1 Tax=Nonlabens agnitus TaxID=870484 RepID=A0A2S9WUI5_9FLAO|nr:glycosyltransferase family A protein [Nonlabens agnitus]PRP66996.1 hypothetical protein BST86_07735 [Nonlabens agnitus]